MSNDTITRILMSAMGMAMFAIVGVAAGLHTWMFALPLVWFGAVGVASPEIERAWARSRLPGSDNCRRSR